MTTLAHGRNSLSPSMSTPSIHSTILPPSRIRHVQNTTRRLYKRDMATATDKQHRIVLVSPSGPQADARGNPDPGYWKSPVTIDDADLTFDGKPLNLLHEENQRGWMLEHHVFEDGHVRGRRRKVDERRREEVSESFFLSSFPSSLKGTREENRVC